MKAEKTLAQESGFTLIEVIVVIAILGIVSAALIPQLSLMSTRARLKTDVESMKVLQHQLDIYSIEYGDLPANNLNDMVSIMVKQKYFNEQYIDMEHSTFILETKGAQVSFDPLSKCVKLKVTSELYNLYDDQEKKSKWMVSS